MKKIVGISILALLLTVSSFSQEKRKKVRQGESLSTEQMATLQTKKMALHLDLNESQQSAVAALMQKQMEERKLQREALREKRQNGEKLTADEKFALRNDQLEWRLAHKEEMKKILSDTQYEKWDKMNADRRNDVRDNFAERQNSKRGNRQGTGNKKGSY
jgi:hypothetical protein